MRRNIVGSRVRLRRRELRLTQDALAARLQTFGVGLERAGVSKVESGMRRVTDSEVLALAECLGVDPNWLLDYGGTAHAVRCAAIQPGR